jgi:hypothetical protein
MFGVTMVLVRLDAAFEIDTGNSGVALGENTPKSLFRRLERYMPTALEYLARFKPQYFKICQDSENISKMVNDEYEEFRIQQDKREGYTNFGVFAKWQSTETKMFHPGNL